MKGIKRFFKRLIRIFETDRWLFLDDTREPPIHLKKIFYIVRDYDDFVEYIETYGIPEIISFDHDLNLEHTNFFFENGGFRNPPDPRYENFKFKTGYDCALWLIDYCKRNNKELKKVFVHSHNLMGQRNIYNLICNFQKKEYGKINCKIVKWKYQK